MNISLLDPFAALKDYPDSFTNTLSFGYSVYIKYNTQGNYLASGLSTGAILIIDNDTKIPIRELKAHRGPIQSLSWSSCGRYLLSSSRDWKTYVWDVVNGKVIRSFNFHTPVWHSEFNPMDSSEFIVARFEEAPLLVDSKGEMNVIQEGLVSVVKFHTSGKYIFTGTNKGVLSVVKREGLKCLSELKISTSAIRNIVVSNNGKKLGLNSSDRIIRQINLPEADLDFWTGEIEIENKYQDIVNRIQWNSIYFSDNSEYLIASAHGSSHSIYVWETTTGSMIHLLQGPDEELVDIEWNTPKCTICATGMDTGDVFFWSLVIPQTWSSLAPDFVEIDYVVDYQEREDEFDFKPDDDLLKHLNEEEDEVIDVCTKEATDARGNPLELGQIIPVDFDFTMAAEYKP